MHAAWAIAIASSVLGAELQGDANARVEGRSRTVDSATDRSTGVDLALRARLEATVVGPDLKFTARYNPALRTPDVLVSANPDVLHAAELGAEYRLSPAWRLRAAGAGEYGTTDLLTEARSGGSAPDTIPTLSRLRYASLRTDLSLEGSFDPRTRLALGAGFFAGGGADTPSRELTGFQRGVRGSARLDWDWTRRDVLDLQATAQGARLADAREAREGGFVTVLAGWRHQVDRQIETRAAAGATAARESHPLHSAILPAAEAGVAHASERLHLSEGVAVRLGSALDRLSGAVDRTLGVDLTARWAPRGTLSLSCRAGVARLFRENGDGDRGSLELRLDQQLSQYLSWGAGLYAGWQASTDPAVPGFRERGGFVALVAGLPPRSAR